MIRVSWVQREFRGDETLLHSFQNLDGLKIVIWNCHWDWPNTPHFAAIDRWILQTHFHLSWLAFGYMVCHGNPNVAIGTNVRKESCKSVHPSVHVSRGFGISYSHKREPAPASCTVTSAVAARACLVLKKFQNFSVFIHMHEALNIDKKINYTVW
jgi:hypothetical protein